jgi:hypothetical protein
MTNVLIKIARDIGGLHTHTHTHTHTHKREREREKEREKHVRTQSEDSHLNLSRESLGGTKPASTLILDLQPPGVQEDNFLLFKRFTVCYLVMVAREDKYIRQVFF